MENTAYVFANDPNGLYVNGQYFYRKYEGDSSTSCTSSSSTVSNNGTPSHNCKGNVYTETTNETQTTQQSVPVKQVTNPFLESPDNYNILSRTENSTNSRVENSNFQSNDEDIAINNNNNNDTNSNDNNNIRSYFADSAQLFDTKSGGPASYTTSSKASHNLPSMNPFLGAASSTNRQQIQSSSHGSNVSASPAASVQYARVSNFGPSSSGPPQMNDHNAVSQSVQNVSHNNAVPSVQSRTIGRYSNIGTSDCSSELYNAPVDSNNLHNQRGYQNDDVRQQSVSASSSSESVAKQYIVNNTNSSAIVTEDKSFRMQNVVQQTPHPPSIAHSYSRPQLPNQTSASFLPTSSSQYTKTPYNFPASSSSSSVPNPAYSSNINQSSKMVNATFPGMAQQIPSSTGIGQNLNQSSHHQPQTGTMQIPPSYNSNNNNNNNNSNLNINSQFRPQTQGYSNTTVPQYGNPLSATNKTYQISPPQGSYQTQAKLPPNSNYQMPPSSASFAPPRYPNSNNNSNISTSAQNMVNTRPPNVHSYPGVGQHSGYPLLSQQSRQQQQQQQPYPNVGYNQGGVQHSYPSSNVNALTNNLAGMSVTQGYNKLMGLECVDLLRCRDILPQERVSPPPVNLPAEYPPEFKCSPDILRCTLNKIPETKSLLDKSRLPLGILLHPFRDLQQLSVINCSTIVRCRSCRTYINPFVFFIDSRHWKCNLCFRTNEVPDDFLFNPISKMYDDPTKRPEVMSATIEYVAPSEYMLRPPQPAVYLFVLDVSRIATQTGYLRIICEMIIEHLDNLPGDTRTSIGFITFDSTVHYYSLSQGLTRPQQLIIPDIDEMFLPLPEDLIVNLSENKEMIVNILSELPQKYSESYIPNSALGAALQAAYKLLAPTGGRVTVFQTCLPNVGPGALKCREDPSQRNTEQIANLKPATDFYKKLGLECNGQHVAIDLFILNSQYIDLVTIAGISQVSGGCMHHFPLFNANNAVDVDRFEKVFRRYLSRKIGFEAVMRLRCTRGLSIHSFHGHFFVRTTDLLALPNVNPDAGFGMQVSIDDNLSDLQNVTLQAALLYTSSRGERRIRVHTLCLPVSSNLQDILASADQQCIIGLLSKIAVDRVLQTSLSDAREAFLNAAYDPLNVYKLLVSPASQGSLLAPNNMQLLPLYILALLKNVAFRTGNVRLDDRVFAMYQMKCLPLDQLMHLIYPELYAVHNIIQQPKFEGDPSIPNIPLMQLSAERIESGGIYLLDDGEIMIILIGQTIPPQTCLNFFGTSQFSSISENDELPITTAEENKLLHAFINYLQTLKPHSIPVQIIKYTSPTRAKFFEKLLEDKTESGVSYHEFLQTIRSKMS